MSCPTECHENIQRLYALSWPSWTRAILVGVLGVLFSSIAWIYVHSVETYSSKEDAREMRAELRSEMRELKDMVSQVIAQTRKNQ